ncbi:TetR/AcrR family transcriptional regulator [Flavobacterium sp. 1355]|uniref:TetR/AcrR family transcriptional regulator n=1 Tax=Flavobacterium sp. 1355 TaxID=2806571 RepID=UPI001AE7DB3C|nr:TetR/AcrR family transcriptional regulator [Flavobacterium sp. 1355]MBP1223835.1 TetR/AcrR family transcriptional repressor of nem operon [Flavobacterium sp. 1355]
MAGRPKIFDEQTVIAKAANIFWEKGYEASSSEELLKAMGIGKGSFYLFFKGGKKELYEKSLQYFANNLLVTIQKEIDKSDDTIQYLKDLFLSIADSSNILKAKGCFMGNSLVEMAAKDEYTRKLVSKLLKDLEVIFTATIQKAKDQNKLKTNLSAALLGNHLLNLWNGLNVTRRMYQEDQTLKELINLNLEILK